MSVAGSSCSWVLLLPRMLSLLALLRRLRRPHRVLRHSNKLQRSASAKGRRPQQMCMISRRRALLRSHSRKLLCGNCLPIHRALQRCWSQQLHCNHLNPSCPSLPCQHTLKGRPSLPHTNMRKTPMFSRSCRPLLGRTRSIMQDTSMACTGHTHNISMLMDTHTTPVKVGIQEAKLCHMQGSSTPCSRGLLRRLQPIGILAGMCSSQALNGAQCMAQGRGTTLPKGETQSIRVKTITATTARPLRGMSHCLCPGKCAQANVPLGLIESLPFLAVFV